MRQRIGVALFGSAATLAIVSDAHGAPPDSSPVIEELLVTAQKRSENIQDVPASVSALRGARLESSKLESLADYAAYLPGFNVTDYGTPGQSSVTLRGIAAIGPGAVVGTYVDETPVGSSSNFSDATKFALDLMPYDIDRLEVLRGPQGTLYGAGAMGGLVKYVLALPNLNETSGRVGADIYGIDGGGNIGWSTRATVNAPIVAGKFAVRASVYDAHAPGYADDVYRKKDDVNKLHQYGGRVAALLQPADNVSVKLNAMWQRIRSNDNSQVVRGAGNSPADPLAPDVIVAPALYGDLKQSFPFAQPFNKSVNYYSATVNWDLGPVDLVSATSWSHTHSLQVQDLSPDYGSYFQFFDLPNGLAKIDYSLDLSKFTQELRLTSSSGGRFEWMLGGFYTRERSSNTQNIYAFDNAYQPIAAFSPLFIFAGLPTTYEEVAAFGNATLKITDEFDISAGGRYARNSQRYTQIIGGVLSDAFGLSAVAKATSDEGVFTWMAGARYHFNQDVMAYVRVATGYRPGGPNIAGLGIPPSVKSDRLKNYEIGLKSEFLDRRALINLSAFYIDWTDIQLTVNYPGGSALNNAGDAVSKGFELETAYSPINGMRLGFNAAYTDASIKSLLPGTEPYVIGAQLPGVPKWMLSGTADYSFPVLGDWTATVGGGVRWSGSRYSNPVMRVSAGKPVVELSSYGVVDLHADVSNDRWTLKLFAKNVTNERAFTGAVVIQDALGAAVQNDVTVLQPRLVGIGIDFKF